MWAMVCSLGLAYLESPSDGGLVRVLRTGWEIMLVPVEAGSSRPGRVSASCPAGVRGGLGGFGPVGAVGAVVAGGAV